MKAALPFFPILWSGLCCVATENCYFPLDVMFLQDTSGSFTDDLPNVVKQIPFLTQEIVKRYPGSMFGVAEFRDKPYYPLGEHGEFCYQLGDGLSNKWEDFEQAYQSLEAAGGGDAPEAQYQALIDIVLDPQVGWRNMPGGGTNPEASRNESGAHVVILSTDALPHLNGDMEAYTDYPGVPKGLPPNSGTISTEDINFECMAQDYPSETQLKQALQSTNTTLIILTPDEEKVARTWKYVNSDLLGQSDGLYKFVQPDSSDISNAILEALQALPIICSGTTQPPTSTMSVVPSTGDVSLTSSTDCGCSAQTCEPCSHKDGGVYIRVSDRPKKFNLQIDN